MAISQDQAKELCSTTEWNTIETTFPPRVDELTPAVRKKQSNRVKRFLDAETKSPQADGRLALFQDALARLQSGADSASENEKLAARREKEKAAREREKSVRDRRSEVKTKLLEKAEKEKLEKEGEPKEGKEKSATKGVRANLQAAGKRTKSGFRKV